ncbi:hypothetical protein D3C86_1404400 [compost metagenome]
MYSLMSFLCRWVQTRSPSRLLSKLMRSAGRRRRLISAYRSLEWWRFKDTDERTGSARSCSAKESARTNSSTQGSSW